jgi:hypothetical protein
MKTTLVLLSAFLVVLGALPVVNATSPLGDMSDTSYCTGTPDFQHCPWMFCWHPHYNQYGMASWCDIGLMYPCQYCVPIQLDASVRGPAAPVSAESPLLP